MDLFDKYVPIQATEGAGYGSSGDMKKTQYMLQLLGAPWDPDTVKCLIVAAEQGMEVRCGVLNTLENEQDSAAYRQLCRLGVTPGMKEADYYLAGVNGILAFINARGLGYSLVPKHVNACAAQDYWIDVAINDAEPSVKTLIQEYITEAMRTPDYAPQMSAIKEAQEALIPTLERLDVQLGRHGYIQDKFSLADAHWLGLMHFLFIMDEVAGFISEYAQITRWYQGMKSRKSNCGQDIIAFSLLPGVEDIRNKKLPHVEIKDF